jgi:hypothetical protein
VPSFGAFFTLADVLVFLSIASPPPRLNSVIFRVIVGRVHSDRGWRQWTEISPEGFRVGLMILPVLDVACFQELPDEVKKPPIGDAFAQYSQQRIMIQVSRIL